MLHCPADKSCDMMAAALAHIHACCFDKPWSAVEFQTLLKLPTSVVVAETKGFLLASHVLDELEILTFCVLPEARRQGIGRRLLDNMLHEAAGQGVKTVFLEVRADNIPAITLYRGMGFYDNGRRPGYYATPQGRVDAVCLRYDF